MNIATKALLIACEAHNGQTRKDGKPYVQHPIRVVDYLIQCTEDIEVYAAGYLHDVKEDTDFYIEDLFNDRINIIVDLLTKKKNETKLEAVKRAGSMWESTLIKMCDRLDNFSEMNDFTSEYFNRKSVQDSTYEILNLANKHNLTTNVVYKTLYQMMNGHEHEHLVILK